MSVVSPPYGLVYGSHLAVFASEVRAFAYRMLDSPFALAPLSVPPSLFFTFHFRGSGHRAALVSASLLVAVLVQQVLVRLVWAPLVRQGRVVEVEAVRDVFDTSTEGRDVVARLSRRRLDADQMDALAAAVLAVPAIAAGDRSGLLVAKAHVRRLVAEVKLSSSR